MNGTNREKNEHKMLMTSDDDNNNNNVCVLQYYNFTEFAMTLNEFNEDASTSSSVAASAAAQSNLPPTDCRLRPDIRKMENGDIGE